MKTKNLYFSLLFLMQFFVLDAFAQVEPQDPPLNTCINFNGSFEEIPDGCPVFESGTCHLRAFNYGCVPNWSSVNGSPDICSQISDISPPMGGGTFMAKMVTTNVSLCQNEAIVTNPDLEPGNTYLLKFYHRTAKPNGDPSEPINL